MKSLFRWPWSLRRKKASSPRGREFLFDVETMLERSRQTLLQVESETEHHWRSLEYAIQRDRKRKAIPEGFIGLRPFRVSVAFAVLAVAVVVVLILWPRGNAPKIYQTGRGQLSTITLADSSEVTLNHTSKLIVDISPQGRSRHVTLLGEAFFHVQKNGTPFIVTTDIAQVEVVGTEFDVRVRDSRLDIGVLTGRVNVSAHRNGIDSTVLLVGGQLTICDSASFPRPPTRLAQAGYPGWLHGKLLFDRASVATVCKEIESKFDVVIRVQHPDLGEETITGALDARSVESALSTLAQLTGASYRHDNGAYILY